MIDPQGSRSYQNGSLVASAQTPFYQKEALEATRQPSSREEEDRGTRKSVLSCREIHRVYSRLLGDRSLVLFRVASGTHTWIELKASHFVPTVTILRCFCAVFLLLLRFFVILSRSCCDFFFFFDDFDSFMVFFMPFRISSSLSDFLALSSCNNPWAPPS